MDDSPRATGYVVSAGREWVPRACSVTSSCHRARFGAFGWEVTSNAVVEIETGATRMRGNEPVPG